MNGPRRTLVTLLLGGLGAGAAALLVANRARSSSRGGPDEQVRIAESCLRCGGCVAVCPSDALELVDINTLTIDHQKCIRCGRCAAVCPVGAITPRGPAAKA